LGYVTEMMEARLALNEIRMNLGQSAAHVDLAALEKDARAKGFLLIAHKAAEAVRDFSAFKRLVGARGF